MGLDPATLAAASLGSQAAGAVGGVFSSYYGAKSQQTSLNAQAYVADNNAKISEINAQVALDQGNKQIAATTAKYGQVKGAQRAAMAANGIDLSEGNAAEIQAGTDLMKAQDVNSLRTNAIYSALGYRNQGLNYQTEAATSRIAASAISPGSAALGSLLTGAGKVAGSWYQFNKDGVFNTSKPQQSYVWAEQGNTPGYIEMGR